MKPAETGYEFAGRVMDIILTVLEKALRHPGHWGERESRLLLIVAKTAATDPDPASRKRVERILAGREAQIRPDSPKQSKNRRYWNVPRSWPAKAKSSVSNESKEVTDCPDVGT